MCDYNWMIKECPFCGNPGIIEPHIIEPGWWTCSINCSKCPGQIIGGGDSRIEAIYNAIWLWNRRVKHD